MRTWIMGVGGLRGGVLVCSRRLAVHPFPRPGAESLSPTAAARSWGAGALRNQPRARGRELGRGHEAAELIACIGDRVRL